MLRSNYSWNNIHISSGYFKTISLTIFNRIVAAFALKKDCKLEAYESQKRKGAVEKVLVKGFKFLSLGIYLTYLTYNVLSLSFLNTFSTGRKRM
jgi:hypothetical protein